MASDRNDDQSDNHDLENILPEEETQKRQRDFTAYLKSLEEAEALEFGDIEDDDLPPFFKSTKTFNQVVQTITRARRLKAPLALITGEHGAGKSTAAGIYSSKKNLRTWECPPRYHEKHLVADMVRELGVSIGQSLMERTSFIADRLANDPQTVVLDEAQRMNYVCLDWLKYLADRSGSTFVLIASPSLERRMARWSEIDTRCTVRVHVKPMELDEFTALYKDDGYAAASLTEIFTLSKGVMRTTSAILKQIDLDLEIHNTRNRKTLKRSDLNVGQIRGSARKVIG